VPGEAAVYAHKIGIGAQDFRALAFPWRRQSGGNERGGRTMKRLILTLVLGVATFGLAPARAQAQIAFGLGNVQRAAQRQVISWYQAYLGRLPNAQELNILSNLLLTGNNALYVQSLILSSNEFFIKSGNNPLGFINRLFVVTLGRQVTMAERAQLFPQLNLNGRLWFTQAFLAQTQGGWANAALQAAAWGYPVTVVPAVWW